MKDDSQIKFFRQFINMLRDENIKKIGIITDKDGTILLDDSLKRTLKEFRKKKIGAKIYLIANSGRTIQDMINCLEEQNIPLNYFDYIVGDNGGMCLDVKENKLLYKHILEKAIVSKVIQEFLKRGGTLEDIRLADGKSIYAYPSYAVKEYYSSSKDIVYNEDITNLEGIDITKLTITGTHNLIDQLNTFVREKVKGYKTHIGKTSFPEKSRNNYRMDFTGMHTKGQAAKLLKKRLGIDTCIYLGNDLNDVPMFSVALDDNDFIVIANNYEHSDIPETIIKYLKAECEVKGINWEDVKILLLEEQNVNSFLIRINRIINVFNQRKKQDIIKKYKIEIGQKSDTRPRKNQNKRRRNERNR